TSTRTTRPPPRCWSAPPGRSNCSVPWAPRNNEGHHMTTASIGRRSFTVLFAATAAVAAAATVNAQTATPTFTKDVAPIRQEKCQGCHRAGEMAPMSLRTYQEVRPWARSIRNKVSKREMPPWFIDKRIGIQKYKNDHSLTDAEIDTIVRWVDGGAREGAAADL